MAKPKTVPPPAPVPEPTVPVAPAPVLSEDEQTLQENVLPPEERMKKHLAKRPNIDHLPDAVKKNPDGTFEFLVPVEQRVVMERYASCLKGAPWLDTRVYSVLSAEAGGTLNLYEDDTGRRVITDFVRGVTEFGYRFKRAPLRGNPFESKRRGRPKSAKAVKSAKVQVTGAPEGKTRRVYDVKGVIHTRIKGVAYAPAGPTNAKDGDRVAVSAVTGDSISLVLPGGGTESWSLRKGL